MATYTNNSYYTYNTLELIQLLEFEQYKNNIHNIYHVLVSRVGFDDTIYALSLEKFNVLLEYIEDYLPYENKSFHINKYNRIKTIKRDTAINQLCHIIESGVSG